jgi:thiosulfate dehydrogenase [quinone] large subunit
MGAPAFDRRSGTIGVVALLLVQFCIGYEWLVSGLTKVVDGNFVDGLAAQLRSMDDAPGWYGSFLQHGAIPHAHLLGSAIEVAELAVGATLLFAAAMLLARGGRLRAGTRRSLLLATALAAVVGIVLTVNFALANGSTFGLGLAPDGFDEGVDLDTLLIGLQLALFVFGVAGARAVRPARQEPISNSRRTSLRLVLRSVFSLRQPTTSAQATSYVPAGNSLGRVPGTTTARGGT